MEVQLNDLILKKTHVYYYQVQGQLHITHRKCCHFIVWTPKGKLNVFFFFLISVIIILCIHVIINFCISIGICVDKIERDDTFWKNKMEVMLLEFYLNHMLPEIINSRLNIVK